ncbi:MAG: hypothetical protein Q9N26_01215 [Aquificota bacterium]|nr:hypothetical protein [Aquificota bacterium]
MLGRFLVGLLGTLVFAFSQEIAAVVITEDELDEVVSGFAPQVRVSEDNGPDIILWDEAKVNGSPEVQESGGVKQIRIEVIGGQQ